MLHQCHQTNLLLCHESARTPVRETRARRITLRRRLRGLLRAPAYRLPMGVQHA
jgi:hypothetical protein